MGILEIVECNDQKNGVVYYEQFIQCPICDYSEKVKVRRKKTEFDKK